MSPSVLALDARFGLVACALAAEATLGYPDAAFRAIRHPVSWIGALIAGLDRALNRGWRRVGGVLAEGVLVVVSASAAVALQATLLALPPWLAWPLLTLAASSLLAQRSLHAHVAMVEQALRHDLDSARRAVAHIVGRNPRTLDAAAVARAAIESLAENFSDAVVAPALWGLVAGLPGVVAYKAVNTADSMVGHRTPRHEAYGWAAARLDDLANLPASRLAVLWLALAACLHRGASPRGALRAVWRDAGRHRSPNAGWPEAALAGALGLRLAGPRVYGETLVDDAWMGDGRGGASPDDIRRALALYRTACALQLAAIAAASALIARG